MGELIDTLLAALTELGLPATRQFPMEQMPRLHGAAVAVGLQELQGKNSGFADYLGLFDDPALGTAERYGKKLTVTLLCRVFAPDGDTAARGVEDLCALLICGIPGIHADRFSVGECTYDREADCCVSDVTVTVTADFYAQMPVGEEPTFQDFRLESEWI